MRDRSRKADTELHVHRNKARKIGTDHLNSTMSDQEMICWGSTAHGQLGLGGIEQEQIIEPRVMSAMTGRNVRSVACGMAHTLLAMRDGTLYSCGNNDSGQLGHTGQHRKPEQIAALEFHMVERVACGCEHSVALTDAGLVFCWGDNKYGQLGLTDATISNTSTPRLVKSLSDVHIIQIVCGSWHTLALSDDGYLYSWGANSHGQLGDGPPCALRATPIPLSSLSGLAIAHITCGAQHSFALSVSGALYGWGKNAFGQLGVGDEKDRYYPTLCRTLRSQKVKYIVCGENHTAALTKDGGVFTFGAGAYGQLGHNSMAVELMPKKVFELMGNVVTQIACGRQHTVAYIASAGRLYSFGLGGSGQLGVGDYQNRTSPAAINGPFVLSTQDPTPQEVSPHYVVHRLCAGGDQTFVIARPAPSLEDGDDYRLPDTSHSVQILSMKQLDEYALIQKSEKLSPKLVKDVHKIFSSSACFNASFLLADDRHYDCGVRHHGLDLQSANEYFTKMATLPNTALMRVIADAINEQLRSRLTDAPPDAEAMRLYLTLPYCHLLETDDTITCQFAYAILQLTQKPSRVIMMWLQSLLPEQFIRHTQIYKSTVVRIICKPAASNEFEMLTRQRSIRQCVDLLAMLNKINELNGQTIAYSAFYIHQLNEVIDIRAEYVHWIQHALSHSSQEMHDLNFCNYPFVFDAEAKSVLLQTDALIQMQVAVDEVSRQNFTSLFLPMIDPVNPMLTLLVHRENIVRDTVDQLAKQDKANLKKPLQVIFIGEEALDAGGVRKEFFMLLLREILDPKYGMFQHYEESRLLWFNELTFEDNIMFSLIGVLCGLAIYNSTIVDIHFPVCLYKKLLRRPVTLDDVKELWPTIGKGLADLLSYDGDDIEDVFNLDFQITRDEFGQLMQYDLITNGSQIIVNSENRQEYVDAYMNYVFNVSVENQFGAFNEGFHKVCGGRVLELFNPQELQAMIVGNEEYDWLELEKNAEYRGVYNAEHETIKMFWHVFHELSEDNKKKFLRFLTGSDRIPIHGMKAVKMCIQSMSTSEEFLPVAHTCFNLLDLPIYKSKQQIASKLLIAIQHTEGFGLV